MSEQDEPYYANTSAKVRQAMRDELASDVEAFLAKGNKVKELDHSATGFKDFAQKRRGSILRGANNSTHTRAKR